MGLTSAQDTNLVQDHSQSPTSCLDHNSVINVPGMSGSQHTGVKGDTGVMLSSLSEMSKS